MLTILIQLTHCSNSTPDLFARLMHARGSNARLPGAARVGSGLKLKAEGRQALTSHTRAINARIEFEINNFH